MLLANSPIATVDEQRNRKITPAQHSIVRMLKRKHWKPLLDLLSKNRYIQDRRRSSLNFVSSDHYLFPLAQFCDAHAVHA